MNVLDDKNAMIDRNGTHFYSVQQICGLTGLTRQGVFNRSELVDPSKFGLKTFKMKSGSDYKGVTVKEFYEYWVDVNIKVGRKKNDTTSEDSK